MSTTTQHAASHTVVNPWTWQDALGFSQAVVVDDGRRRTLYAAGQMSMDPQGRPVHLGDMEAQARQVMVNLEVVLAEAGMHLGHVVRWDVYTTDLQRYFELGHQHVAAGLCVDGRFPAGGVAAQVVALAVPGLELELTVTASA